MRDKIIPGLLGALLTVLIGLVWNFRIDLKDHGHEGIITLNAKVDANIRTLARIESLIEDIRRGEIRHKRNNP